MKILLYTEGLKAISKSGLGKAIGHQKKALEDNKIKYTTNLKDDYDIYILIFTGQNLIFMRRKQKEMGKELFIMPILQRKTLEILFYLVT